MDMFSWFRATVDVLDEHDPTLTREVYRLAGWACDGERARIQASVPRLLAEARRLELPWLEIYVRHWALQSRVARHYEVAEGLSEAVSLVERAHRPDARECPQSVCAVQDLCMAYSYTDGPGYAAEREQAARETLARIDPTWPCWRCIGEELVGSMVDRGRAEEALEWLQTQLDAEQRRNFTHARVLRALGRVEEALAVVDQIRDHDWGALGDLSKATHRAMLLADLGRLDEAEAELPPWSPLLADACEAHEEYVEALAALVGSGQVERSVEITQRVAHIVRTLRSRGALRPCVNVALRWVRVVVQAEPVSRSLARELLDIVDAVVPQLRGSFGAAEAAAELRDQLAALPAVEPGDPEAMLERLRARDPESPLSFDEIEATALAHPEHRALVTVAAQHWSRRGFPEIAERYHALALQHSPGDPGAVLAYARFLADEGAWDRVDAMLDGLPAEGADLDLDQHRRWYRGRACEHRGDVAGAMACYQAMITADAAWCGTGLFERLADLQRDQGDPEAALRTWSVAVETHPEEAERRWNRLVAATELERWSVVREDAAALELPVDPGEGTIDEDWGTIRLLLDDDTERWALRTGPATARVLTVTAPQTPERHGELWAFVPAPFQTDDDGTRHYRARSRLRESEHVGLTVDGAALGDDGRARLEALVEAQGGEVFLYSDERYHIADPESDTAQPAQYFKLAIPRERVDPEALAAGLAELAQGLDGPLIWLELCRLLGRADEAAAQEALGRDWGML